MINAVDSFWKTISRAFRIAPHLLFVATVSVTLAVTEGRPAWAQADGQPDNSTVTSANRASGGPAIVTTPASDAANPVEASLFSSLFMSGKTQDQFKPLTARERSKVYAKDLLSPFHFFLAGVSAGITQLQDSPKAWGLGAQGYGIRFANYYGNALIGSVLQMTGEDILHEDNLYYGVRRARSLEADEICGRQQRPCPQQRWHATFFGFAGWQHRRSGRRLSPAFGSRAAVARPVTAL